MKVNSELLVDFSIMAGLLLGTVVVTQSLFWAMPKADRDESAYSSEDGEPLPVQVKPQSH